MNNSPVIRPTTINLWTLGHRRYYSPMMRVPGGLSAAAATMASRVRPSLGLRREVDPAAGGAAEGAVSAGNRATIHAHGAQ